MRAVVCGAGPSGLTLAAQLAHYGCEVILVERESCPSAGAYLVDLSEDALLVAGRLGLTTRLRELGERTERVRWIDSTGKKVAELDFRGSRPRHANAAFKILRADLERVLLERLPCNVQARFGYNIARVHASPDGVEVDLHPGGTVRADVVIGTGRAYPQITERVQVDESSGPSHPGYDVVAFVFEDPDIRRELAGAQTILSLPDRQVVLCPLRNGAVAANFIHKSHEVATKVPPAERLTRLYEDLGWCVPALLEHARAAEEIYCQAAIEGDLRLWHQGRVALLGAGCSARSAGSLEPVSLAMAGAFRLSQEITHAPSIAAAFAGFQCQLQDDVTTRRGTTRNFGNWPPATYTELLMRNNLLRLAAVPGISRLFGSVLHGLA